MSLAALFIIVKTGNNANFHDTWLGKTICDITIKWNTTHKMECNSDIYTQQLEWISKILRWAETWLKNTNTKKKKNTKISFLWYYRKAKANHCDKRYISGSRVGVRAGVRGKKWTVGEQDNTFEVMDIVFILIVVVVTQVCTLF